MTSPIELEGVDTSSALDKESASPSKAEEPKKLAGRSPSQLMWARFKRDRTGVVSAFVVLFYFLIAAAAPLISMVYGKDPYTLYGQDRPELLDMFTMPAKPVGGIDGEFWFGIEPGLGRDVLTQLVYGIRTSLATALAATIIMTILGVLLGLVGGYFGGRIDYWLGRVTDFFMALPSQLFFVAAMPVITTVFVAPDEETPTYVRTCAIIIVLSFLGWMSMARIVRGATLSLRDREFIEAARISGASPWRIIRKELLPNIVTPTLVQATLTLPSTILSIAFLSFVGVGYVEPTPDWGRMFAIGANIVEQDPYYMLFPGIAMVIFVVAFNLLGDSVRDAFDPKTGR
ncbi:MULTISPECIES: ABC transporter permease [unclassified Streptomyces]|uniref:ABC transporter permease n=1 Tax=unclassified Streptomyces TaxID=2593676 RepID=UPI0007471FD1|nr:MULTISPECIES: ABC transporter permease [unclassified Streptomyces]KUL69768.1 ABC transporter permease [Streptomyces sp. NRRL WC-3605]KUL75232.1 ABC transporter permease [Streptomyces sp. NRRL WC-3604]